MRSRGQPAARGESRVAGRTLAKAKRRAPRTDGHVLRAMEKAMWEQLGHVLPGWPLTFVA